MTARKVIIIALSLVLILGGRIAWVLSIRSSAMSSAKHLAGDLPYCIQVPQDRGYVEIRSTHQLTPRWMNGSESSYHAVLAVGSPERPRLYHWSYFAEEFVEGRDGYVPPVFCDPRPRFLMMLTPDRHDDDEIRFRLAGNGFSIPSAYQPQAVGGRFPYFHFTDPSLNFAPLLPDERAFSIVTVKLSISDTIQVRRSTPDETHAVTSLPDAHGLHAQSVIRRGYEDDPDLEYFELAEDGRVVTIVRCRDIPSWRCSHMFESGGWTYTFGHPYSQLEHWRDMHRRVIAVVSSFRRIPTE